MLSLWIVVWMSGFFLVSGSQSQHSLSRTVQRCDDGWVFLHRDCYKFSDHTTRGWADALLDCQRQGAELISISNLVEMNKIKRYLKRMNDDAKRWWIGLQRNGSRWQWLDASPFSYRVTRWAPGEPNNKGSTEHCGEMTGQGELNDKNCNTLRPYICEKPDRSRTQSNRKDMATTTTPKDQTTSAATTARPAIFPSTTLNRVVENSKTQSQPEEGSSAAVTTTDKAQGASTAGSAASPSMTSEKGMSPDDDAGMTSAKTDEATTTGGRRGDEEGSTEQNTGASGGRSNENTQGAAEEAEVDLVKRYAGCFMLEPHDAGTSRPFLYTSGSRTCPAVNASGVEWPVTSHGETQTRSCKQRDGEMVFRCGGNPTCWRGVPDMDQCVSKGFKNLLNVFSPDKNAEPPTPEETLTVTSQLAVVTEGNDVTEADIVATSKVIKNLALSGAIRNIKGENEVRAVADNVVAAGSNVVSPNKTAVWADMAPLDRIRSATSLLVALETSTLAMAQSLDLPVTIIARDDNFELQLRVVNLTGQDNEAVTYDAQDSDTKFSIPVTTLRHISEGNMANLVFMTYYTMGRLLENNVHDNTDGETSLKAEDTEKYSGPWLNSHIQAASVAGIENTKNLPKPVTFTMTHTKDIPDGFKPLCSFWKISESGLGQWSQEGCRVINSNRSHTRCECDHMTNFAILMSIQQVEISDTHMSLLRLVTIVGCVISCICLLASWVTFTCFTSLQGERNSIHKHLVVCLFVAELLFLAGIDQTNNRVLCGVIAGFLHYFFLAAFLWMLMEGVHIILMLVQVFDASRSRMPWFYAASYAPPILIIAISAGLYPEGYGTDTYCWLTTERGFIWSFAGPVAAILFANSVILIYAMTMVCRHSEYVFSSKDKSTAGGIRSWIQGALALEVLLGLTWVVGFLFLSQQSVAVAYIFTVLNSTQGLFIFVFHCLLSTKARKEYRRVMRVRRRPSTTGSGSGTHTASLGRFRLTGGPSFNRNKSSARPST